MTITPPEHDRPVWHLEVGSYRAGWTYELTAGEQRSFGDFLDGRVLVVEPFSFSWRYPANGYPGQLEPETATITLRCLNSDWVPDVDQGDDVFVRLYRPGPAGDPVTSWPLWFDFDGILSEPELTVNGDGSLTLTLVAVDPTAQLAELNIGGDPFPAEGLVDRLRHVAELARINLNVTHPAVNMSSALAAIDVDNKSTLDVIRRTLAGALFLGNQQLVLRALRADPLTVDDADAWSLTGLGPVAPDVPMVYFLQPLSRIGYGKGVYRLAVVGGTMTVDRRDLLTAMSEEGRIVLPAASVRTDGTTWRKSREDAVNQVKLTGINGTDPASGVAQHADLVKRFGANARTVDTDNAGTPAQLASYAAALLPEADAAVPKWTLPSFLLLLETLADDQLDALTGKLYPARVRNLNNYLQRSVSLLGVSDAYAITGSTDVHGTLTGVAFSIVGGQLTATCTLNSWQLRPLEPTFAELRADPDAAIARFHGVPPVPFGTSVLDAALTYDDMRQVGEV